jgi:hypothetical protein
MSSGIFFSISSREKISILNFVVYHGWTKLSYSNSDIMFFLRCSLDVLTRTSVSNELS